MNVSFLQAIGCFTVKGKINSHVHSHHTSSEYDPENNTVRIKGALIIGWISTVVPRFPAVSKVRQLNFHPL